MYDVCYNDQARTGVWRKRSNSWLHLRSKDPVPLMFAGIRVCPRDPGIIIFFCTRVI